MLSHARCFLSRALVQNYKTKVSAETLTAIAGLDADVFGFSRPECCGPVPEGLPGSFQITDHVILNTALLPTEWAKRAQNVPHFRALQKRLQEELPSASIAVCHTPEYPANTVLRFNLDSAANGQCRQYTVDKDGAMELPWQMADAQCADCSAHHFVFICAHRLRDARCGYCGPVLVDVMSQEVKRAFPNLRTVHVIPCSHFGGHVYAGNVLLYSKHGGICFGCVTPDDAEAIIDFIRQDDGIVPDALQNRVRGRMTSRSPNGPPPR
ncbi:hypothetical protein ABL78_0566 [Leptomonas seymouri]|uniref:Sucrase/ferredoxin-like family protein n=1 Tax=Leptomonas seymouri TaxID=5684 RepID=A0A0N0P8U1_LEPSE|nr:hypothetical protein ABL78_0566 [Leptomonas seymouri]|eukprot:KPI90339.1 hypothetical protein ABL78_0566 [Leptomonas seymouri]